MPANPARRPFTVHDEAGHTVVVFHTGSLDEMPDVERVGLALYRLIEQRAGVPGTGAAGPGGRPAFRLVLDFRSVEFFSSQGVGLLLGLSKKVTRAGGSLTLCGVGPHLRKLLEITRLDRMLTIAATRAEAVAPRPGTP